MKTIPVAALLASVLSFAGTASADLFTLDTQSVAGICAGSCGTVDVTYSAGTIHFAIDVAPNVDFGQKSFGFNVVGSTAGVTISNINDNTLYSFSGDSGAMDGLGTYEFIIDGPTANQGATTLSFDVTRPGDAFTSVTDVYSATSGINSPAGGGYFAAHVHNEASGMPGISGFVQTGITPVPDPSPILLLGTVFAGCLPLVRSRVQARRKSASSSSLP